MGQFDGVLSRIFPPFVQGVLAPIGPSPGRAHPEEQAMVAGAAERRRREFLSGRTCAHAALAALGRDDGPIGVGARRQPEWPAGVVGSISHGRDWAGAVVALDDDAWGLGFDIEVLDPPLGPDVERLVQTPAERQAPPSGHSLDRHRSKIAYSVKESVYKCVFPRTGWRMGFHDVAVAVDLRSSRARARVDGRLAPAGTGLAVLDVEWVVAGGYVFTGCASIRA
jgi:4'-phosphopantetheinyl transferase EntD